MVFKITIGRVIDQIVILKATSFFNGHLMYLQNYSGPTDLIINLKKRCTKDVNKSFIFFHDLSTCGSYRSNS
jgi:hypothetical protein